MRKAIICVVILALLGLAAYRVHNAIKLKKMEKEKTGESAEVLVTVSAAVTGTVESKISLTGDIEPQYQVVVYSRVSGEVEKLAVDVGDSVEKGGIIAQIEKEKLVLQVERLDASLESAEINLKKLCRDYERMKSLFEKNAISQQKMDNIDTVYKSAQAQVKELKAALALAGIQLKDSTITAPIKGIVARKFVEEGDIVTATSQMKGTPLAAIVDMDIIKVVVNVTEGDMSAVRVGQEARVKVDACPDKVFIGRVSNISPVFDSLSRTAPVEIKIANPEHLLRPGMFARVEIITGVHENVLIVPISAIVYNEDKETLFILKGNTAGLREVKTDLSDGEIVEIVSGLSEGEKVIIDGSYGLKDGDRVSAW